MAAAVLEAKDAGEWSYRGEGALNFVLAFNRTRPHFINVRVTREFLETIENDVLCQRPSWRVDAAKITTLCDYVLLMTDHSMFPPGMQKEAVSISVEIKPKCGFLRRFEFIAEENAIKRSIARFKMHQALKLHQGKVSKISQYDPCDMFSGSRDRVQKAIEGLFRTPQNNFRVFLDGAPYLGVWVVVQTLPVLKLVKHLKMRSSV